MGGNATCKDHEWLLDALISEVSIWGCEECGQGSRTLPTANSEFLRSLVPLNGDAKNGARCEPGTVRTLIPVVVLMFAR